MRKIVSSSNEEYKQYAISMACDRFPGLYYVVESVPVEPHRVTWNGVEKTAAAAWKLAARARELRPAADAWIAIEHGVELVSVDRCDVVLRLSVVVMLCQGRSRPIVTMGRSTPIRLPSERLTLMLADSVYDALLALQELS